MAWSRFAAVCLALWLLVTFSAPGADAPAAADVPRYDLRPGRKVTYSLVGESKSHDNSNIIKSRGNMQLTVLRANDDGSRRVLVRSASSYAQVLNGREHPSPERVVIGCADLFPDGRVRPVGKFQMSLNVKAVLPPLPPVQASLAGGWSERDDQRLELLTCAHIASDMPNEFAFTTSEGGMMSRIYVTTQKQTVRFDRARGIVTSIDGETSQGYGFNSKGTSRATLEADESVPAEQLGKLADEFDRFFAAKEAYDSKMVSISEHPADATRLAAEAEAGLKDAESRATLEPVKKELAQMLASHADQARYAVESASRFKGVLDRPAADWSTTDIDGKPVTLSGLRGKIIVMDFWYRGCGWCMYAMPQIKQIADDYRARGVVVLGMNTDRKEEDARFVIDALQLNYPTIKAIGIPEKYQVQGFPTLIIIDQEGIVRTVHVGYSPDLRQKLSAKLDALLAKSAQ